MKYFEQFLGYYVLIKNNQQYNYYCGDSICWLLDWWLEDTGFNNQTYIDAIQADASESNVPFAKLSLLELKKAVIEINNHLKEDEDLMYVIWFKLPNIIIDFDAKILYNNVYDYAFEDKIPVNWQGVFIEQKKELLELIPQKIRYWELN